MGVLDLDSTETESATMGTHCEPNATKSTVRRRRPCLALKTTREMLPCAATPSLGRKLPASARIPTTSYTATEWERGACKHEPARSSALGTTRMTLLLPATPSLGCKLPASARSPTTPFTATERKTWLLQPPAGDQLLPGTPGSRS